MGLKYSYFITSRTTSEVSEVGVGGSEGAGSELDSSPKNETQDSTPNTIATGMSFAKVKNVFQCSRSFIIILMCNDV